MPKSIEDSVREILTRGEREQCPCVQCMTYLLTALIEKRKRELLNEVKETLDPYYEATTQYRKTANFIEARLAELRAHQLEGE